MVEYSDQSVEATRVMEGQRARLRRFREALTSNQSEAARAAGVSVYAWNNMELGKTRLSAVAPARFCEAYDVPAEYVITGRLTGLPDALVRQVVAIEREEEAALRAGANAAGTPAPGSTAPSGMSLGTRKNGRRKKLVR